MNKRTKAYICVGENYVEQYFKKEMGMCGDIKTLDMWIDGLFGEKKAYFDGYTNKEILEYIYKNCGKRLKEYKP